MTLPSVPDSFVGRPLAEGQGSGRVIPKAGALPRSMKLDGPPFFARSMEKDVRADKCTLPTVCAEGRGGQVLDGERYPDFFRRENVPKEYIKH